MINVRPGTAKPFILRLQLSRTHEVDKRQTLHGGSIRLALPFRSIITMSLTILPGPSSQHQQFK